MTDPLIIKQLPLCCFLLWLNLFCTHIMLLALLQPPFSPEECLRQRTDFRFTIKTNWRCAAQRIKENQWHKDYVVVTTSSRTPRDRKLFCPQQIPFLPPTPSALYRLHITHKLAPVQLHELCLHHCQPMSKLFVILISIRLQRHISAITLTNAGHQHLKHSRHF